MDDSSAVRNFFTVVGRGQRWRLALLALLVVMAGLIEFVAVLMLPLFVYALSQPSEPEGFGVLRSLHAWTGTEDASSFISLLGVGVLAMFALRTAAILTTSWYRGRVVSGLMRDVSLRLFANYLRAPYTLCLSRNTAQFIDFIIYGARQAIRGIVPPVAALLLNALLFITLIPVLLAIDPAMAVSIGLVAAAMCYVFMRINRERLTRYAHAINNGRLALQVNISEGLGALKHTRLRGAEAHLEQEFSENASALANAEASSEFTQELPRPLFELLAGCILILAALVLLRENSPSTVLPMLALAGAITLRMLPIMNALTGHLSVIRANAVSLSNVARELRNLESQPSASPQSTGTIAGGDIEFRDIEFRYPGEQTAALKGIDLLIRDGQSVAFVGPTGSGKSTIVDVMLGFLTPSRGVVTVGGRPITEDMRGWRRRVGYVPQSIFLTDASILRNIALGLPAREVDEAAVWRALEQAQLAGWVASLPKGLHTEVGERGVRLSGGQLQRLGIARALFCEPQVLLLDEATAALDNATEARLIADLRKTAVERTTIFVAHRLSSVRHCDRIFLIKDGSVSTAGTYQDLLAGSADFRDLAAGAAA